MLRRVLQILSLMAVIALLASCSKAQAEDKKVSGKPVVVVEETTEEETLETTAAELVESVAEEPPEVDSGDILAGDSRDYEYDEDDEDDEELAPDVVIAESEAVEIDEAYLKECPPCVYQASFDTGDISYKDELTDDVLLDLADKYHDEGYMILSADKMAENGAVFSCVDGYYFYRGFMAALYDERNSEVRYYFMMSEDLMFQLMEQFAGFTNGFEETDDMIVFDFGNMDGISMSYNKQTQILEYVMWANM